MREKQSLVQCDTLRRINETPDSITSAPRCTLPSIAPNTTPEFSAPFANAYVSCLTELIPSLIKFIRLRKTLPTIPKIHFPQPHGRFPPKHGKFRFF
mgnify:CR=1 FL=1